MVPRITFHESSSHHCICAMKGRKDADAYRRIPIRKSANPTLILGPYPCPRPYNHIHQKTYVLFYTRNIRISHIRLEGTNKMLEITCKGSPYEVSKPPHRQLPHQLAKNKNRQDTDTVPSQPTKSKAAQISMPTSSSKPQNSLGLKCNPPLSNSKTQYSKTGQTISKK